MRRQPGHARLTAWLAALPLLVLFVDTGERHWPLMAQAAVPPDILARLPAGSELGVGFAADLTGSGQLDWVLLYDIATQTSTPQGGPIIDDHLAIVVADPPGWRLSRDLPFANGVARGFRDSAPVSVQLRDVAGTPAVAVLMPVGVHAGRLAIVRWDGADFVLVFTGTTADAGGVGPSAFGLRGLQLEDVDGDGIPEVVQRAPAGCVYNWAGPPHLLAVYRWDGSAYRDATGHYSHLLAAAQAEVQAVLSDVLAGQTPPGAPPAEQAQACLRTVLASLALQAGDTEQRDAECSRAVALDSAGLRLNPWVCADLTTYQDADLGFAFSYPQQWGEVGYENCGPQRDNDSVRVGSRIEVAMVPTEGALLSDWVHGFLDQRTREPGGDWRIESVDSDLLGGLEALTVTYRFGGVRRLGMATFAERGAWMYIVGFTAGGDACDLPTEGLSEFAVYHHLLATFQFLGSE